MSFMRPGRVLTLTETARALDVSGRQVLELVDNGELRWFRAEQADGGDGRLRFGAADVARVAARWPPSV